MISKMPKIGDILISTEAYYSVIRGHGIFRVIELQGTTHFLIEVLESTFASYIGAKFSSRIDEIGIYYVNIS